MSAEPVILIIDDDPVLGRSLVRLAERTFPQHLCLWARDGIAGVNLAREHAAHLRLIVLDIAMPRMDGNLAAVQIRALAPQAAVLPFSAHAESWPMLRELGCAPPVQKHPDMVLALARLMREAYADSPAPLPELPWVQALRQSGTLLLSEADHQDAEIEQAPEVAAARALMWLEKYCGRFPTPAREVLQARKLLRDSVGTSKQGRFPSANG